MSCDIKQTRPCARCFTAVFIPLAPAKEISLIFDALNDTFLDHDGSKGRIYDD